jgi:antitoxin PrlF
MPEVWDNAPNGAQAPTPNRGLAVAQEKADRTPAPQRVTCVALPSVVWHTVHMNATIVLGKQGRIVIPAEIREQLGLAAGDQLHLRLAGTRLVIERPQDAVNELRQLASAVAPERSLVQELLAERRAAAAH